MKIQIRQPEIEEALRDYVAKQGINLRGRSVEIMFTSGRKSNGLTADVDISDAVDIPDFPSDQEEQPAQAPAARILKAVEPAPVETVQEAESAPAFTPDPPEQKVATTSLFGGN